MRLILDYWGHFLSFKGTIKRGKFWVTILLIIIQNIILLTLASIGLKMISANEYTYSLLVLYASMGIGLLNFFPSWTLAVRRLHDIGKSGFWLFLLLVPLIGSLVILIFYLLPSKPAEKGNKYAIQNIKKPEPKKDTNQPTIVGKEQRLDSTVKKEEPPKVVQKVDEYKEFVYEL